MKNRKKEKIMNCIKNMLHRENIFLINYMSLIVKKHSMHLKMVKFLIHINI